MNQKTPFTKTTLLAAALGAAGLVANPWSLGCDGEKKKGSDTSFAELGCDGEKKKDGDTSFELGCDGEKKKDGDTSFA